MAKLKCSFCGAEPNIKEQIVLIQAERNQQVYICSNCILEAAEQIEGTALNLFSEEEIDVESNNDFKLMKPSKIKEYLDEYIIGQEKAKMILAVSIYNHYKRLTYNNSQKETEMDKSNILLLGPTGTGKTLFAKTIAKLLDVPLAIADCSTFTEAGYVGNDVENCLKSLLQNADWDVKKAERGIVYLDEFDKISRKGENVSITRDVSGEGVQQALLKMIEGSLIEVPPNGGRKHPNQECVQIDTSNILFICGGAFEGIEKIIEKRKNKDNAKIGFGANIKTIDNTNNKDIILDTDNRDLQKYGIMPEILGRLPIICPLQELDEKALVNILTQPKNAIVKQYKELLSMDNIKLTFEKESLSAIAKKAINNKTGARGLRTILENILLKYMYILPDDKDISEVIITKNTITNKEEPKIIRKKVV